MRADETRTNRDEFALLEQCRVLRRAQKSLYGFPLEVGPAGMFLFAGWLRLEQKARAALNCAASAEASVLGRGGAAWRQPAP